LINENILVECFRTSSSFLNHRISPLTRKYEPPRLSLFDGFIKRCDRQFLLHQLTACPTIPIPDGRSLSKQRAHSHSSSERLHDARTREPVDSSFTLPPQTLSWTPSLTWMLPPRGVSVSTTPPFNNTYMKVRPGPLPGNHTKPFV